MAKLRTQIIAAVTRAAEAGSLLQLLGETAAGQFQGGDDACALGWPKSDDTQRVLGPAEQCIQAAGTGEQFATQRNRILAAAAAAQQHGQQFGVGQRGTPAGQQFFAGTFTFGPVADTHFHNLPDSSHSGQR